jgi:two-component system probable response regulator PhcQ
MMDIAPNDNATASGAPLILFVDDEATAVKYFQRAIGSLAPVVTAASVDEGIVLLDRHADTLAVLVSDQRMPGRFGNELLRYARERYPHMVRILTTAYSELEFTVEAINEGQIHRYIKKPWEISTLRMELKQALELSDLRRERDHLLHEKMLVREKQTVSNRIGLLYVLCVGVLGQPQISAMETYLAVARKIGVRAPVADWQMMDYCDLVSAEAQRGGGFARMLYDSLGVLQLRWPSFPGAVALQGLADLLDDQVVFSDDVLLFRTPALLTEFLECESQADVSENHAIWLAFLIWVQGAGWTVQSSLTADGLECRLTPQGDPTTAQHAPLANWIDQF